MPPPNAPTRSSGGALADVAGNAILAAYRGLTLVLSPVLPALLAVRAARGKADPGRVRERYGHATRPRPAGRVAWVHAASVGETLAMVPLVARIVAEGWAVIFTSGTVTSAAIARERLPAAVAHQYAPLDVGPYVARFLRHWRPELAIVAESELWPATFTALAQQKIPVIIVNGRLSDRSFPRWRRFRALVAPLFGQISLVLAQSAEDAQRFLALGARPVMVTGNLKWDAKPLPVDQDVLRQLRAVIAGRPVWLAASTHAGEEEIVADVHRRLAANHPRVLTIVVPRHPQRGGEVAAVFAATGLSVARRSQSGQLTGSTDVYVADTLGELGLFYRLVDVTFLGNSLIAGGGHNPLEPVQLGAAVIAGPNVHNFAEAFAQLAEAEAKPTVADAEGLARLVDGMLKDPAAAKRLAHAQAEALSGMTGTLDATFAALRPYLSAAA